MQAHEPERPDVHKSGDVRSMLVALGDTQFGKGVNGVADLADAVDRAFAVIDEAYKRYWAYSHMFEIADITVAFLGDHVEGFQSQGGANTWRTQATLTDQIRCVRRLMLHALKTFASIGVPVRFVAVPGNHDEAVRVTGKGVTRYDDSHDVEALIAVADAARLNPEAFGHVSFHVPETDELAVALDLSGTWTCFVHGHKIRPGKHHEWVKGQAYNRSSLFRDCDLVLVGHYHHEYLEASSDRLIIQVPALESESQWWKHVAGEVGRQGIVVAFPARGRCDLIEYVRAGRVEELKDGEVPAS